MKNIFVHFSFADAHIHQNLRLSLDLSLFLCLCENRITRLLSLALAPHSPNLKVHISRYLKVIFIRRQLRYSLPKRNIYALADVQLNKLVLRCPNLEQGRGTGALAVLPVEGRIMSYDRTKERYNQLTCPEIITHSKSK